MDRVWEGKYGGYWHPERGTCDMPDGYAGFSPGNTFFTRAVRELCEAAGQEFYKVMAKVGSYSRTVRYWAPAELVAHARALDGDTESERGRQRLNARVARERKEQFAQNKVVVRLLEMYPRISIEDATGTVSHAWSVGSRRVGRSTILPLDERIYLATQAHVRHQHTEYSDLIVYECMAPDMARRIVFPTVNKILKQWKEKPVIIGGGEPYTVRYVPFDERLLQWLREDPERLFALDPEDFEKLVVDRMRGFGLEVYLFGETNQGDGGIDFLAYPMASLGTIPFLVAGQIKHKSSRRHKVAGSEMREFLGAIENRREFQLGIFVTNTAFRPNANWVADNASKLVHRRGMLDLRRWLNDDFQNEAEWLAFPREIRLSDGPSIPIGAIRDAFERLKRG